MKEKAKNDQPEVHEHLEQYRKSSYTQRLEWLTKAMEFTRSLPKKKNPGKTKKQGTV